MKAKRHGNTTLISARGTAAILGVTTATLANYRWQGRGPRFIRVGRLIRYRLDDVERWINEHTIETR